MSNTTSSGGGPLPRQVADAYVDALVDLDPITGTFLGIAESSGQLPDFSPTGQEAVAQLARTTLERLTEAEARPGADSATEKVCARLLRERLTAELAVHEAGEGLRTVSNLSSPLHHVREVFTVTPDRDRRGLGGDRPAAARGARRAGGLSRLAGGRSQAGPPRGTAASQHRHRAVDRVDRYGPQLVRRLHRSGRRRHCAPSSPRPPRWPPAPWWSCATGSVTMYAPAVAGAPDLVGRERYARLARYFNGADLDLDEAYAYGWSEFHRLLAEMETEAEKILPGAKTPWEALAWLDDNGEAVEGVEEIRQWLQSLMDEAIDALDGTHFELAERVRRVESRIAPVGSAAAPYYTQPSLDFSRPGRTWLPTMGETRFPAYDLVSTWYHEGVPGHHLQLAQWAHVAEDLSRYQTTVGIVSANAEGWALYAERLMDELGFLSNAERRLGYLDAQMMRAVRVIIDIGMHLELEIPADSPFHPGERWTPELAHGSSVGSHSSRPADFVESELDPLPGDGRAGDRLQARRAHLAQGPGGGPCRGTARTSTSRHGTWRPSPRARSAWTIC